MEFTCIRCAARFRAAIDGPLAAAVRLQCPACKHEMLLRPARVKRKAVIADEERPFRAFLADQLTHLGFNVVVTETGDVALELIRRTAAQLAIVNVYLKGKLGVEIAEQVKRDPALASITRIVLIGALFRANRFRANPTNLYGADEYIEEQIPEKEFRQLIQRLFPMEGTPHDEERDYEEAHRLARLILSDIIIYHPQKVREGIRSNTFFELLHDEIEEGRQYYRSRVPLREGRGTEIFEETLRQFVLMKREELDQLSSRA